MGGRVHLELSSGSLQHLLLCVRSSSPITWRTEIMASEKEKNVYLSKLAEQAERYDEMAEYMKLVAETREELSVEERNLLSVAYKNAVGSRRASWRIVSSVEQKETSKDNAENATLCGSYRTKVEGELNKICDEILKLLKECLLPSSTSGESKVFYYKMQGDYYRYIAEYTQGDAKTGAAENARVAYDEAMKVAQAELLVTHPIRLGLALNFSVFHYEELDNVSEDSYKDSTLIMQLLRDNLTLWTSDQEAEGWAHEHDACTSRTTSDSRRPFLFDTSNSRCRSRYFHIARGSMLNLDRIVVSSRKDRLLQ